MTTIYNEIDPYAAAWLTNLAAGGHIASGVVDTRSIKELTGDDLRQHDRVHLFAGIGGWDYALRLAGWPADRPVWTGSCPCQPYSAAGKGAGDADPRNLWPDMLRLIGECRPDIVFGEQVADAIGHGWLDRVSADLEAEGYAVGAVVLGAHSVGGFHRRQRLYWVADADPVGRSNARAQLKAGWRPGVGRDRSVGNVADADPGRRQPRRGPNAEGESLVAGGVTLGVLGEPSGPGLPAPEPPTMVGAWGRQEGGTASESGGPPSGGFWSAFDALPCTDGKTRPVEPGTFPLAHGVPGRVGQLRGYGNAIVPQVAAEFVAAFLDVESGVAA